MASRWLLLPAFIASLVLSACAKGPADLEPSPLSKTIGREPARSTSASTNARAPQDRASIAIALSKEAWVYAAPNATSAKIGYLRAGQRVKRATEPTTHAGCDGGWFEVEPRGYVCFDASWTSDPDAPIAELFEKPAARDDLPYLYVRARYPTPRFYARLPSRAQQGALEPKLDAWLRKYEKISRGAEFTPLPAADPLPRALRKGEALPGWDGGDRGADLDLGRAKRHAGFAILASYEHEGRRFGLTSDLSLTPLDRSVVVEPSNLHGARLGGEIDLPIAIVKAKKAKRYGDYDGGGSLSRWSVVPLSGKRAERGGRKLLETTDGDFVRADQVGEITRYKVAPVWAERGDKWIDVSLLKQTLVAYEGKKPVFATLVSTGADGIAGHEGTHATIQGTFLIHTKHLTITMNSDEQGSEFDLRDVPFVQYFSGGYALHAAYWHDDFGTPRSHGCVNLSPHDAAWLFGWTTPDVPEGWNGALSDAGTLVHIHP